MKSFTLSSNASILAWSGSVKIQEDKNTTSIISNAAIELADGYPWLPEMKNVMIYFKVWIYRLAITQVVLEER